jgi:hypothetical protein
MRKVWLVKADCALTFIKNASTGFSAFRRNDSIFRTPEEFEKESEKVLGY